VPSDRGLRFGGVADLYERARPSYPAELVDDVANLLPGPRVVEVGAGTGKATRLLVQHSLRMTCLEPDPAMAVVLRSIVPSAAVVESTFEAWQPTEEPFDGLVSAQAWHWTDEQRWDRAASVLRPGGLIAVWWNVEIWGTSSVERAIEAAYIANGLDPAEGPIWTHVRDKNWPENEFSVHPRFEYLGMRAYPAPYRYTSKDFSDYLDTSSHHRVLDDEVRARLSAAIRSAVDGHGGEILVNRRTHLYIGRRH
jgi:SAM-dependent methyltransferase